MWVLSHIESRHKLYILNNKETYTVGRVQHDLILLGDTSVSRDHANIYRTAQGISVEDKSRYGIFINKGIETNKGIGTGSKVKLKVGDVVRFGRLKSIFRVEKIEIKVCCSMMPPEEVQILAKQLQIVDGKLQNNWDPECTHLVMLHIVVTMKVLESLIQGIPIVTPAYYGALIKYARENRSDLPNVNDFVPEITEPFLVKEPGSMQVHLDRQRIFQGKTFVFMVKRHMINFRSVIELAAGKCISLEEDRLSKKSLLKENYIPVAYSPVGESQCSEDVNGIVSYIEGNNRRLILEAEIGLAIIHRSIDRFCNPDHKTIGDFQVSTLNTNELRVNILVDNTPSGTVKMISPGSQSQTVIPETANSFETEPNNNRNDNKMVEEEILLDSDKPSTSKNVQKRKPATPIKSPTTRASSKRKLNAVVDVEKEPSNEEVVNNTRSKKAKQANAEEKGEDILVSSHMSTLSSDLMPPPSSSVIPQSQSQSFLDSSGFISTQHRKRTTNTANESRVELEKTKELTKEEKDQNRKRAIALLNADSDDDNDKDDGDDELFKFSKKPVKKSKMALRNSESRIGKKRTFVDVSDDDSNDDNPFQFSKSKVMRSQQSQKKKRTDRENEGVSVNIDTTDHAMMNNENSFMTTRKTHMMKSKIATKLDIKETSIVSTDWIISKINENLDLNVTKQNVFKEKKEEEGGSVDEEKHSWVKSLANVFQTRRIDVNLSRNSVIDETDSVSINQTTSSTLNKSKNFKKFVKKNNYTQSSVVVKTTATPVVVSAYSRL